MSAALLASAVSLALAQLCPNSTSEKVAGGGKTRPRKSADCTLRAKNLERLINQEGMIVLNQTIVPFFELI